MRDLFQLPTRLDKIENELTKKQGIHLYLKRDDLIHPEISGNKWRKLKYNIEEAKRQQKHTLLTFGGAYSNHITATAATGKYVGFKTIGIIRGEEHLPLNASLQFAQDCGMQLHYIDRTTFKKLHILEENFNPSSLNINIGCDINEVYIIPEGGANKLALKGCSEMVDEIQEINFDYICCASGTGATIAGIASNLKSHQQAIGFAVLKHENLAEEIKHKFQLDANFTIYNTNTAYAKTTPELLKFIHDFQLEQGILLDYVYTGKMLFYLFKLIEQNYFPQNTTIVAVHTGGVMNARVG